MTLVTKFLLVGLLAVCASLDRLAPELYRWSSTDRVETVRPRVRRVADVSRSADEERPSAERRQAPAPATTPASEYDRLIEHHAKASALSTSLVRAVIQVESAFDPRARSRVGAMGLMQLMPETAADLGVVDPFDPDQNLRGGTAYLSRLLRQYGGNETLALAAYNAGPGAVTQFGNRVPPYPETQHYVARVRALARAAQGREWGRTAGRYAIVDGRWVALDG